MKKISFIPSSKDCELLVDPPKPSKTAMPEWYKKSPTFKEKEMQLDDFARVENKQLKMCIPFFDALSGGYIQKTWTDIFIKHSTETNTVKFYYASSPEIIRLRDKVHVSFEDCEFYNAEFVWLEPWYPKLPKGYSMLFTHPFNRLDLPFFSLSAVVDSDKYYHTASGQYPFYIKRGFSGIIPAGTPMYQMIPFKRDSWISKNEIFNETASIKNNFLMQKKFFGAYKKFFWQKKNFG